MTHTQIYIYIYIAIYIYLHTPMFTYIVGVSFQHGCLRKVISFPLRSLRRSADAGVWEAWWAHESLALCLCGWWVLQKSGDQGRYWGRGGSKNPRVPLIAVENLRRRNKMNLTRLPFSYGCLSNTNLSATENNHDQTCKGPVEGQNPACLKPSTCWISTG